jgi:hypothetical protein
MQQDVGRRQLAKTSQNQNRQVNSTFIPIRSGYTKEVINDRTFIVPNAFKEIATDSPSESTNMFLARSLNPDVERAMEKPPGVRISSMLFYRPDPVMFHD